MAPPQQNRSPERFYSPMQGPAADQEFRQPQNYGYKIPSIKDMKLPIERFTGKEEYPGLGSGFKDWGLQFLDELVAAQLVSGGDWSEEFKLRALNRYLEGPARKYFDSMKASWAAEECTVAHLLNKRLEVYEKEITVDQATRLMQARKPANRTWVDQYQYLIAVAAAANCPDRLVLQYICEGATPETRRAMFTRLDRRRGDHLRQAWELADFASTFEQLANVDSGARNPTNGRGHGRGGVRTVANAVTPKNQKRCYQCNEVGHIKRDCKKKADSVHAAFALSVANGYGASKQMWILDSGASRHLIMDSEMLVDAKDCDDSCEVADGQTIKVSKVGSVNMLVSVDGEQRQVTVSNVYYAECLAHNLLSYYELEKKGVVLSYTNGQRYLKRASDGAKVFEVMQENNVLTINMTAASTPTVRSNVVFAAVRANDLDIERNGKIKCTLLDLHKRLGHLAFDTVEKMADASSSEIELIDRIRPNCLTCAQGKQSKNAQSKQDTGEHSPIDRIEGVICSDLKGPMTPIDRNKNRYMVNFIDHASNYCRVFVAKTKDQAAKMFEHFLVHFERMFNCKVHVLRTDGGGEYKCVDLFCKSTEVIRQVSEAKNQASNGKAERMHRTVLNMARCMIFASGIPLYFWGDAVQYATYVLNRSPSSANTKRMSPLEVLTGKTPNISDIVVFGSPCTVYRNPGKKAWKPRAEVGMIIGKHDETKGFKVYIPRDRVVVTTQHVKNVETLDGDGNRHLQEQLRREDPTLKQSVLDREEVGKRKEQLNTTSNGKDTTEQRAAPRWEWEEESRQSRQGIARQVVPCGPYR